MDARARILVTREQAEPLAGLLAGRGVEVVHVPLIVRSSTGAPPPQERPDVVLVTSARAVQAAPDLVTLAVGARIVAVGPATADALAGAGAAVDIVGASGGADALALAAIAPGDVVWHVGGQAVARPLADALAACVGRVVRWQVYRTGVPPDAAGRLGAALPVDVLTFASPSAVDAFADLAEVGDARVAVIGSTTAAQAATRGLPVHAVARQATAEGLAAAALELVAGASWPVSDRSGG